MTPADKKYNVKKNGRTIFWIYLVQISIVSFTAFMMSFGVITELIPKSGTAFAREPWLWYSILIVSFILTLASCIAILLYRKKNLKWADWTICIGIVLALLNIIESALKLSKGMAFPDFGFRYNLFMISTNLAFVAFLIEYKANAKIAVEKYEQGRQPILEKKVNPLYARILFSIAAYSLCIEIGFTCAIVIPVKAMSIIGSVLVAIVALIIMTVVFGNLDNEEEYIDN